MNNQNYRRLMSLMVSACRDYRYFLSSGFHGGFILESLSRFIFDLSIVLFDKEYNSQK